MTDKTIKDLLPEFNELTRGEKISAGLKFSKDVRDGKIPSVSYSHTDSKRHNHYNDSSSNKIKFDNQG